MLNQHRRYAKMIYNLFSFIFIEIFSISEWSSKFLKFSSSSLYLKPSIIWNDE